MKASYFHIVNRDITLVCCVCDLRDMGTIAANLYTRYSCYANRTAAGYIEALNLTLINRVLDEGFIGCCACIVW